MFAQVILQSKMMDPDVCFILAFAVSTLFCKVSRADVIFALWGSTSARMAVTTVGPLGKKDGREMDKKMREKWILKLGYTIAFWNYQWDFLTSHGIKSANIKFLNKINTDHHHLPCKKPDRILKMCGYCENCWHVSNLPAPSCALTLIQDTCCATCHRWRLPWIFAIQACWWPGMIMDNWQWFWGRVAWELCGKVVVDHMAAKGKYQQKYSSPDVN